MRKLFVILTIAIFAGYMYMAGQKYTLVEVPQYQPVTIELRGGKTKSAWDEDPTYQKDHIKNLARIGYHPPKAGLKVNGDTYPADTILEIKHFREMLDLDMNKVDLRDPTPLYNMERKGYRIRNPIPEAKISAGTKVTKDVLDQLIHDKVDTIAVVGNGGAVEIQWGTLLMVIIIFLGMEEALRFVLWEPLLKVIDERKQEIDEGATLLKTNRQESEKVEAEGIALRNQARREYMDKLAASQREAMKEADVILKEARTEAHRIRDKALSELNDALTEARSDLEKQIPEMSDQIAAQVLGRPVKG